MSTPGLVQPPPYSAKGISRQFAVRPCRITAEDLRRLYKLLEKRAREASDYQTTKLTQQPGQTVDQFKQLKEYAASLLKLVVTVYGAGGEWMAASTDEPVSRESLPDSLATAVYDSAPLFRAQMKVEPLNSFTVVLDFSRTHILDLTNLAVSPDPNSSSVRIVGENDTWVKAVNDDLKGFFDERARPAAWLYSRFSYDLLLWFIGLPFSFALVYRLEEWITRRVQIPVSMQAPFYLLLFILSLVVFRVTFNYTKWVFPKIEGPNRRVWPVLNKSLLVLMGAALVSLIVESAIRAIRALIY